MTDVTLPSPGLRWLAPILRTSILAGMVLLVWTIAGHWSHWTGAAALQSSDDAYIAGDLTPSANW